MALSLPFYLQPMVTKHGNKTILKTTKSTVLWKIRCCSDTSAWVKRQVNFSLLQKSITCIRGSRSKKYNIATEERMDIDVANLVVDIKHSQNI